MYILECNVILANNIDSWVASACQFEREKRRVRGGGQLEIRGFRKGSPVEKNKA